MKAVIEIMCLLAASAAFAAFDSEAWLAKREMLTREAERLRAAYTNCVELVRADTNNVARDITIPVETFPDGSVKTAVHADKAAIFLDKGFVWAEGVTLRKMDVEGQDVARIDARNCVIDRTTKSGWAEGPAKLRHGTTEFDGEGIYFSSPEGYVMVMRQSKIVSKDLKFGGLNK